MHKSAPRVKKAVQQSKKTSPTPKRIVPRPSKRSIVTKPLQAPPTALAPSPLSTTFRSFAAKAAAGKAPRGRKAAAVVPDDDTPELTIEALTIDEAPVVKKKAAPRTKKATGNEDSLDNLPTTMNLTLNINDPEIIKFLHNLGLHEKVDSKAFAEKQQTLASNALKIGVLALQSAQQNVDVQSVHNEIDRMMSLLNTKLTNHNQTIQDSVQSKLKEYFDPKDGRFEERIRRLLNQEDGELTNLIKHQVVSTSHALSENLTPLIGPGSKLITLLDPENKAGIVSLVQWAVAEVCNSTVKQIINEFSLDNKTSSLCRLVKELREISTENQTNSASYLKELSLDNPNSALNRLVKTIETGQKDQLSMLTLDSKNSSIARLRSELMDTLQKQEQQINKVEQLCIKEFSQLSASQNVYDKLAKRTTLHGLDFETKLFEFVSALVNGSSPPQVMPNGTARPIGSFSSSDHIVEAVGNRTGNIRNCKVGDILVTMGPEHISAGAKIVIEAKAEQYNLSKALEEISVAKKNRSADVGIFVYSGSHKPEGLENLKRYGNDVVVVWSPEDPLTNIYMDAAISISKALLIRKQQSVQQQNSTHQELDQTLAVMSNTIIDLEKELLLYDDLRKFAETIHSSTEKMLHRLKNSGQRAYSSVEKINEQCKTVKALSHSLHMASLSKGEEEQLQ